MHVHELRDAGAEHGGKAANLARLIAAGLPVPAGFVIDAGAFEMVAGLAVDDIDAIGHALEAAAQRIETAEINPALVKEVNAALRELGPLVIVRSSSTVEDVGGGAAPGVFESVRAVPVADVWPAIRAVWASALAPLAAAYSRASHAGTAAELARTPPATAAPVASPRSISVIVQRHLEGELVSVYTRDPRGDDILVQRGAVLTRVSRDTLPVDIANQHAVLQALRAERAIDAPGGADVELVQAAQQHDDEHVIETWVVQARPIVRRARPVLVPPPPIVLAQLDDGRTWTWDVAHNPDPLSPAQQGLVERVERAGLGAFALRVCAGYLYMSPRAGFTPPAFDAHTFAARARELEASCTRILAAPPTSVADAIERYLAFYAIWANELSPLIASARAASRHARAKRPSSVQALLAAAARGELARADAIARLADLAPAWDIAVAPFGEQPDVIEAAIAALDRLRAAHDQRGDRDRPRPAHDASVAADVAPTLDVAALDRPRPAHAASIAADVAPAQRDVIDRGPVAFDRPRAARDEHAGTRTAHDAHDDLAADFAERDDFLFARAQRLVRTALVTRAAELGLRGDAVFWLPLDEVASADAIDPMSAGRRAAAARAAAQRAAHWQLPIVVGPGAREVLAAEESLRGVGSGPRVVGRVVRFASLSAGMMLASIAPVDTRRDVVVVRAVTPALAVLVARYAALVSETGGLLDHGAAMARELGITCVVGCRDAWSVLDDGMMVAVDGDAGTIAILDGD